MPQSQQSDFSPSLYDDDLGNLSYLPPSNHLATSSSSQYMIEPSTLTSFDRISSPTMPFCLQGIGPDQRKAFVLYDKLAYNDWVDWWLQTDFWRKSKIKWDSTRHSEICSHYNQVAHSVDGAPKVMCQRCGAILEHPHTVNTRPVGQVQYYGTSTTQRHLKTAAC